MMNTQSMISGFRNRDSEFRIQDSEIRNQDLGFRNQDAGIRIQESECFNSVANKPFTDGCTA